MEITARQRRFFEHKRRREAFASEMEHRDRVGVIAGMSSADLEALGDGITSAKPAWCGADGYYCEACGPDRAGHCAFRTHVDVGVRCVGCGNEIGATS